MTDDSHPPDADDGSGEHSAASCGWCPVCMLVAAAGELRPEVRDHLRAAGRELGLALRAVLADVEEPPQADTPQGGLRRIQVEGD